MGVGYLLKHVDWSYVDFLLSYRVVENNDRRIDSFIFLLKVVKGVGCFFSIIGPTTFFAPNLAY